MPCEGSWFKLNARGSVKLLLRIGEHELRSIPFWAGYATMVRVLNQLRSSRVLIRFALPGQECGRRPSTILVAGQQAVCKGCSAYTYSVSAHTTLFASSTHCTLPPYRGNSSLSIFVALSSTTSLTQSILPALEIGAPIDFCLD